MASEQTDTRTLLLDAAEALLAEHGFGQVATRDIVEAAGQKNTSAISYHFGSRTGMLDAILLRHGDPIDKERGELLAPLSVESPTDAIVAALVAPMVARLAEPSGRCYLRIVAQLTSAFAGWRDNLIAPQHLNRALEWLEDRPNDLSPAIRSERVLGLIMLMSASLAERARLVEAGEPLDLTEGEYQSNLCDMLVGVVDT